MDMEKDWIANAYEGMSRRQFLAQMTAAGAAIAGFAVASKAVAGEIITTPADGLAVADAKVRSAGFDLPIYLARPAKAGKYPVVIVLPEIWGMHEYIKDVVRRFAQARVHGRHLRALRPRRRGAATARPARPS